MIRSITRTHRVVLSAGIRIPKTLIIAPLRFNSTQVSSQPKQFKRSTLPSSFPSADSMSEADISNESQSKKATKRDDASRQLAYHMDDLKATKCINQLISDHNDLPLSLSITERASLKLQNLIQQDNNPNVALKLKVESGGCHGFQYDLKLCEDYSKEFHPDEDDTMFVRDGVARIIIDKTSLEILRDSKLDYVNELIGSQFKIVDSPYTSSSCGCGASFDFDFDKLNETAK